MVKFNAVPVLLCVYLLLYNLAWRSGHPNPHDPYNPVTTQQKKRYFFRPLVGGGGSAQESWESVLC